MLNYCLNSSSPRRRRAVGAAERAPSRAIRMRALLSSTRLRPHPSLSCSCSLRHSRLFFAGCCYGNMTWCVPFLLHPLRFSAAAALQATVSLMRTSRLILCFSHSPNLLFRPLCPPHFRICIRSRFTAVLITCGKWC